MPQELYPGWQPVAFPDEDPDASTWATDLYSRATKGGVPANQVVEPWTVNQVIQEAGWTPEAAAWLASAVPVYRAMQRYPTVTDPTSEPPMFLNPSTGDYEEPWWIGGANAIEGPDIKPLPEGAGGAYIPGHPGEIRGPEYLPSDASTYAAWPRQVLEHEAMHAYESQGNPGGTMDWPAALRERDYRAVLRELQARFHWPGSDDEGWRRSGIAVEPQTDDWHYNQQLFRQGFGPWDIPDWYREKYLREYTTEDQDRDRYEP